jgi:uncharacterized membrane protein
MRLLKIFCLFLVLSLCILPVQRYLQLNTSIMDLGIFANQVFEPWFVDGRIYKVAFGHFQPYYLLLSSVYWLFSSPLFLICLQMAIVLSSLFFLPEKKIGYVLVFLLCYAVWYNALFDFHYDHLAIPLMMAFYYVLGKKRYRPAYALCILVALIKEPFGLVCAFMGIYAAIKHRKWLPGMLIFCFGFAYFYAATHWIIPAFTPGYDMFGAEKQAFAAGGSLMDIILYPLFQFPDFVLSILSTPKWLYLAVLLASFGVVVPFFSPLELIPALPMLGIALLAHNPNYYGYAHHYTAGVVAPFTVAFIYGYPRLLGLCTKSKAIAQRVTPKGYAALVFVPVLAAHVLFAPSPLSRHFWTGEETRYHFSAYVPEKRNERIKSALRRFIPSDTKVVVSSQNTVNWGRLAHRTYFFPFPNGICDPGLQTYESGTLLEKEDCTCTRQALKRVDINADGPIHALNQILLENKTLKTKNVEAEYAIVDLQRPLYLIDKKVSRECFQQVLKEVKKRFKVVYAHDGFYILQRTAGQTDITG